MKVSGIGTFTTNAPEIVGGLSALKAELQTDDAETLAVNIRAQVNAATAMQGQMAATRDGIFSIGSVAVKLGSSLKNAFNVANVGSGWGFWSILLAGALLFTSTSTFAGVCTEDFEDVITAAKIDRGKYISFASRDFADLAIDGVQINNAFLTLVVRGNERDLRTLDFACNGQVLRTRHGFPIESLIKKFFFEEFEHHRGFKAWWWSFYWKHYLKYSFARNKDSLVITVDLTHFLVNANHEFRRFFEKLLVHRGSVDFVAGGRFFVLDASLRVEGKRPIACHEQPTPTPVATATPAPTPAPTAIPAPQTKIDQVLPAEALTNLASVSVAFSADQAGVSFFCSLDGAASALCTSPIQFSSLGNGSHRFTVYAVNASGVQDVSPATYDWTVDTIQPDVRFALISPQAAVTNSANIRFAFSSSESTTFQCSLDGAAYSSCLSPIDLSGLGEGSHEFNVIAVDDAGNTSLVPAQYQWNIDQTAPATRILSVAPSQNPTSSDHAEFTFAASESAVFECAIDAGAYFSCASPALFTGLSEGAHEFSVVAIDVAGNRGASANYLWVVDQTAPTVQIASASPANGSTSNARTLAVNFSANEASNFDCSFDGAAPVACTGSFAQEVATEGLHTLVIYAVDLAGNRSAAAELSWTLDFASPMISFGTMVPSSAAAINSNELIVPVTSTEPVTYSGTIDGLNLDQGAGIVNPIHLSGLSEGQHILALNAVDSAGNPANSITHVFTVDLTAPVLSIGAYQNGAVGFAANESANFECSLNNSGFAACTSPFAVSGLIDGTHSLTVRATDVAGNVSALAITTWVIDTVAPATSILSVTPSAAVFAGDSISIGFAVNESASISECSFDAAAYASCVSPIVFNGLADGEHVVLIRSRDSAGNLETSPASYRFTVDRTAPVVSLASSVGAATNQNSVTFTFTANETVSFECALDSAAMGACSSPSGFAGLADGTHTFAARGRDSAGNMSTTVSFVWTVNTKPVLTTSIASVSPSQAVTEQTSVTFSFVSSHSDATFQCSLDSSSWATCSSPATYSGLLGGVHNFAVRAVAADGAVDPVGASYSWTVDTTFPAVQSFNTSVTRSSFTVNWTTNKPTTTAFFWGTGADTSIVIPEDSVYTTTHSVTITGLNPNTVYSFKMAGHDQVGRYLLSGRNAARTSP